MIPGNEPKLLERRKMLRADRVVAIKHRLIKRNTRKLTGVWSLSTTKNMSLGGLLFLSTVPYKSGDIIEISVVISGIIDIVKGNARVVRVVENGNTSFDVAVKLVKESPRKRAVKTYC